MKRRGQVIGAVIAFSTAMASAIVQYDIPRYQVILDREPFGAIPVAPPVVEAPVNPLIPDAPPAFIKRLRMCAITDTDDYGLRVGIVDIKAKPAKSYFFRLGDTQDGIEMIDANYEREGALLKHDGQAYWIYLDGTMDNGTAIAKAIGAHKPPPRAARPRSVGRSRTPGTPATAPTSGSYAERLRKRREILEDRRKKAVARESAGPEALKKQLQDYQMELIRAGGELGPALPIPLTQEMDKKLVAEGVLPPQR